MKTAFVKSLLATTLLGAVALAPLAHAEAQKTGAARNVVLVHGAFADETSWDKVAVLLRKKGYTVTEVANPLTSLADDVAATNAALKVQTGPVVLVGHSWGGVVIGEAGADPKVKSLVYIAAFAPDTGESIGSLTGDAPPTEGLKTVRPDDKGFLSLAPETFPAVFAGDVPLAEAEAMAKKQLPVNSAVFGTPSTVAAWHVKPTFYAISANDLMIPPQAEAFFAQRMKATTITLTASHASMVSQPEAIVALIEQAAQ